MAEQDDERRRRRLLFEQDAALYDRARPAYPTELFADLAALTGLAPASAVLEIGSGTGQATEVLLQLGANVVAVELGASLIEVARRRLELTGDEASGTHASGNRASGTVRFVNETFEQWELPHERFDIVAVFTAWHWLDPELRTLKAAAALRPGGALVTVTSRHVAGGSESFFEEVEDCYERWLGSRPVDGPGTVGGPGPVGAPARERLRLLGAGEVPPQHDEVEESGLFEAPILRRYEWEQSYSSESYLELLRSYSDHRELESDRLDGLLSCVGELIDERHGGRIVKRYLNELRVSCLL